MADKFKNIFLIGPMGSGKTTIGRQIAQQTSLQFFDCDQEIVQRSGVEISWIFEQEGEAGFRHREHEMLQLLTAKTNIVLATGGGCITNAKNRPLLTTHGVVVYLQVGLEKQLERLQVNNSKRPLFVANNSKSKLQTLNEQRQPLYESIADLCFNTDSQPSKEIATAIIKAWRDLHDSN